MAKTKIENNSDQPIKLGRTNSRVDSITFADDLGILIRDITTTQKQIEIAEN